MSVQNGMSWGQMAWPRLTLSGTPAEGPRGVTIQGRSSVCFRRAPFNNRHKDKQPHQKKFFLLLLVMSQGTGWKCVYEADETVAFSDICWTGVFQCSSRPRKGSASESVPTGRDEKFCFLGFPLTACQVGKLDLCHCVSYLDDVFQTVAKNHTFRVSQQIVATQ